ncbi:acyltransferase [Sulfurovum sp. bin170]|uniref:acyltransferase n=1 Tax=Sulfurovum sp. bin170 TaxID=2695268 RepID=UPI0013DF299E|nr:acyltransferase [Sulfurovum sp. bin170]NEW60760.1 acyltransferase [Sulfurovum sp. bin170]
MINGIISVSRTLYFRILPKSMVAKIRGVQFGKNCNFHTIDFGSEPYLIKMGDNVRTAAHVSFITHTGLGPLRNIYPELSNADFIAPIIIGNNVQIGSGVTILANTTIGDNVIIGAGSVVQKEVKSNSIYAGIPAKYICSLDEFKEKNMKNFSDTKNLSRREKKEFLLKKYDFIT